MDSSMAEMKAMYIHGETLNMIIVWSIAISSILFCNKISTLIAPGTTRLCIFLPIFCIFFYLPLLLTSVHFAGMTSFFITWLANFKLLLFAFNKGPLFSNPPLHWHQFILSACVPIKISQNINKSHQSNRSEKNGTKSPINASVPIKISQNINKSHQSNRSESRSEKNGTKSPINYSVKLIVFILLLNLYNYADNFNPMIKMALFCVHIYVVLDLGLAVIAYVARAVVGLELEPQFDEPYLATSLQDFWGKRWNLMVTGVLHPTVYLPVRLLSGKYLPAKIAPIPAFMASFIVSGLMHELIFYYLGRLKPTFEVTWFFVLHGVLLGLEVVVKRKVNGRLRLPAVVSGTLTLGLVVTTSFWLFFPPFLRCETELRSCKEFVAFMDLIIHGKFVGANDVSCPYF